MTPHRARRAEILRGFGATDPEVEELLVYGGPIPGRPEGQRLPLQDEPGVLVWAGYAEDAAQRGVVSALRGRLPQLHFAVRQGMSEDPLYRACTRRGEPPPAGDPSLGMHDPDGLRLFLHPTAAGRLPVIVARDRRDFDRLVRVLTRRNEPAPIPASMGACIVAGYNNWDRIRALRAADRQRGDSSSEGEFLRSLPARRAHYQDVFVILSEGGYSGVTAESLGLGRAEWEAISLTIRLEHECAHYLTRRTLGTMRHSLHDELVADYAGIRAALGRFRADWFLRFMGLEREGARRRGGRLENYRGTPPLSDGAFDVLAAVLREAARTLEAEDGAPDSGRRRGAAGRDAVLLAERLLVLARTPPEVLASMGTIGKLRTVPTC